MYWSRHVYTLLVGFFTFTLALQPSSSVAQDGAAKSADKASPLLHYQGRLTGSDGEPVADSDHTIVFRLYAQQEGGTALWQETQNVTTSNGVFSAQLGSVNGIDGLDFDQQLWLEISVDGGEELTPRTRLAEVPYAMHAYSIAGESVGSSAIQSGAVTASALGSGVVSNGALQDEAVTAEKVADRAIDAEKLAYGAVDSAALDAEAVRKTLDPLLDLDPGTNFVGVNRADPVTGSDVFSVHAPVEFDDTFGGMYVSVEGAESWPFYGYATGAEGSAWHYFDPQAEEWVLEFDFTSPRHRLMVTNSAVLPGGDGDVGLGNDEHRWSSVYAENGTIQTSDRRLKTGIESLDYGLEEVLRLEPVSYRWKDGSGAEGKSGERKIGLVAQQVREVVDEVVKQPQGGDGYLGMNYAELIPVLVRAVQQQQKIIERQGRELRARKNRDRESDEKMRSRIETLEKQVRRLAREVERQSGEPRPVRTASGE